MPTPGDSIQADFVIIGATSGGCVLAAWLSEAPATKVVLLEAGGEDRNMWIHIPLGFGRTFADKRVNWRYETAADAGAGGGGFSGPAGKLRVGLHRSTAWSASVFTRGLRPLAPARQHRLVGRRCAAVLQACRTPDPRRRKRFSSRS